MLSSRSFLVTCVLAFIAAQPYIAAEQHSPLKQTNRVQKAEEPLRLRQATRAQIVRRGLTPTLRRRNTPSGTPPTWTYLGCYEDLVGTNTRDLPVEYDSSAMTIEYCQTACAGYTYAGVEYSSQCFCGNSLPSTINPSQQCTASCAGNGNEICGGTFAIDIYQAVL